MFDNILMENAKINNYYWDSKLPKFIKKYICKCRRKRLRKKLNLFTNTDKYLYTSSDIYEILIYSSIQPTSIFKKMGQYNLVSTVIEESEKNHTILADISWNERVMHDTYEYKFHIIMQNPDKLQISITNHINNNHNDISRKIVDIELGKEGLNAISKFKYDEQITLLLHGLNAIFGEIAYEFIDDQFIRSERIYSGK